MVNLYQGRTVLTLLSGRAESRPPFEFAVFSFQQAIASQNTRILILLEFGARKLDS